MSLISVALVNDQNDLLYAREFTSKSYAPINFEEDDEFFSILGECSSSSPSSLCSVRQQFVLQSALDQFNNLIASNPSTWRTPGAQGPDAMWAGLLSIVDEFRLYGYMTSSKVKVIAIVEDDILPDQKTLQRSKEIFLKALFADVHSLYVEYILNPFNSKKGNIVSRRFDEGLQDCVDDFNSRRSL